MAQPYDPKTLEPEMISRWEEKEIYKKSKDKNAGKKRFFYLDGPPYTSGKIHIGHAWGKALRDSILRFKRMTGHEVWDQPGFDMHGLPIEVAVEKKLGIENKKEIMEKLGLKKFIEECRTFAVDQMHPMIKDFKRMSVWMNWEDPYMTIKNEYIEGAWWALNKAHENGLLVQGKKSMTWCSRCATALAKHELEYEQRTDKSIFVKFPVEGKEKEFLVIWTTTPWTIPFNLAVMAHPEFDYVKAKVDDETWILAKALSGAVIKGTAEKEFEILEEFKGKELEGVRYNPPFIDDIDYLKNLHDENNKSFTVILSSKFVDLSAGSGLVHCAPGCGPEDYEVGRENGLPAYNAIDEHAYFPEETGPFKGLRAKQDDAKFIEAIDNKGLLVASTTIEHDYAHCWRCKTPVVFKATEQWFLTTEKLKEKMIEENKEVFWQPNWGGSRWFDSWLNNLQDWCISRQRFWGIPLPIWKCECGNYKIISSKYEIKKETGIELEDLHRPFIDEVKIKCECGKEMTRIEDVMDVWLDSGAAWWAPMSYPSCKDPFEAFGKADLVLEGKDQIRGWFNSLMCLSMVSHKKAPYKAVYMHGFTNDSQGRKMSKSAGNVISPYEVIDQYGSDTMRYYMIGGANPGLDLNYNFEDMKVKFRSLTILWNLHSYLMDMVDSYELDISKKPDIELGHEEKYILSKMESTIQNATQAFNEYRLNETPAIIEELFLELSRTYIQLVRDKVSLGTKDVRTMVARVIYSVLLASIKMMAPLAPIITDRIYLNFREKFGLKEESIHLESWPEAVWEEPDDEIEGKFEVIKDIIAKTLSLREKAQQGIRWPLKELIIVTNEASVKKAVEDLQQVLLTHLNIKDIKIQGSFDKAKSKVKADYGKMGPDFKENAPKVIAKISQESAESILDHIIKDGKYEVEIDGNKFAIVKEHLIFERTVEEPYLEAEFKDGMLYLNKDMTSELLSEGYSRELCRRIQNMRKDAGLQKNDMVRLFVKSDDDTIEMLNSHIDEIKARVGAEKLKLSMMDPANEYANSDEFKIRGTTIKVFLDVI